MILISTIYEIAKIAGVSPSTVSKFINNYSDVSEKTRSKVKKILEEQNFQPSYEAQCLSTKRTWTLGLVYFENSKIGLKHPYFAAVIEAFKKEAEKQGYSLLLGSKNDRLKIDSFLQYFTYRSVDGIAIICSIPNDTETKEIIESDFPTVIIDMHNDNTSAVTSNNEQGCRMAIQYLYDLGHKKIAHITGMKDNCNWISNIRKNSYINEMKRLNLTIKKEYIQKGNNFDFDSGYSAMKKLLNLEEKPTAVFAAGDKLALGAIEAIKDEGLKVPDDISVIGFDDSDLCQYVTPKLTTVRQACDVIGKEAANILVEQINKKEKIKINKVIPVKLIIRESCTRVK
ncbi:MAG TPA: LacI family transcriptional regulator [Clostridium sp.]|nr:LacI family transcriptional regulator [Clostridium sp.]